MMRFLTIFFILLYGWRVVSQQATYRRLEGKLLMGKKYNEMDKILNKAIKEGNGDAITLTILAIWMLITMIIEAFYILFSFQYGNIYIILAYVCFWVLILIARKIRSIIRESKDVIIIEKNVKYSIKQMLINLVDLAFFIYMFIVLFIK